jgi:lysophospholipase L1-like esterase
MDARHVATGSPRLAQGVASRPRLTLARRAALALATATLGTLAWALVLPSAGAAAGQAKPASCTGKHWVGVWSASPTDANAQFSRSLAGQTARTVLTPLGTGEKLRVHLTNVLSTEPVTIDAASVAKSASGASVNAKSLRRLRFDGDPSVTIPAGGQVVTDPVRLKVKAFKRLAVSTYVDPSSDGLVTEHWLGRQTSYLASGNQVRASGSDAYGETSLSRFIVAGVDVRAPRTLGAVAALGDSITDGFQGDASGMQSQVGIDEDVRYPDFLARRLTSKHGEQRLTVLNAGISGNRVLRDGLVPRMGPSGVSRLDRDVIGLAGVRTVIVLEGANDLGQPPTATAAEIVGGLQQIVERLKGARLRVLLGTLTPTGGASLPTYGGVNANAIRTAVNDWIRTQTLGDGVVDFDAAIRDPSDPSRMLPAFDSSDHLHPSTAGYEAMAAAVPVKRLGAGKCS